jgi:hypothetical protein
LRIVRHGDATLVIGAPLPRGADGMTLGRFVLLRQGHEDSSYLLHHELVHVRQYRERGVLGFLRRYLGRYVLLRLDGWGHDAAYRRLPEEIEADWQARLSLAWGVPPGG